MTTFTVPARTWLAPKPTLSTPAGSTKQTTSCKRSSTPLPQPRPPNASTTKTPTTPSPPPNGATATSAKPTPSPPTPTAPARPTSRKAPPSPAPPSAPPPHSRPPPPPRPPPATSPAARTTRSTAPSSPTSPPSTARRRWASRPRPAPGATRSRLTGPGAARGRQTRRRRTQTRWPRRFRSRRRGVRRGRRGWCRRSVRIRSFRSLIAVCCCFFSFPLSSPTRTSLSLRLPDPQNAYVRSTRSLSAQHRREIRRILDRRLHHVPGGRAAHGTHGT